MSAKANDGFAALSEPQNIEHLNIAQLVTYHKYKKYLNYYVHFLDCDVYLFYVFVTCRLQIRMNEWKKNE